jgi:hypothetical protein
MRFKYVVVMIKQLKVYEIEEQFILPKINYDDWSNPISVELAKKGFNFLSRLSLSVNKLYRLSDLVEYKHEIIKASKTNFLNKDTLNFIHSVFKLYTLCDHLIEFSDLEDSEDIVVISHRIFQGKNILCLFILNKIMNLILSEKEILENISQELISFEYKGIANILLSEDKIFNLNELSLIINEIEHALKYKFLSHKTMLIIDFLHKLYICDKKPNNKIILMDILKVKV